MSNKLIKIINKKDYTLNNLLKTPNWDITGDITFDTTNNHPGNTNTIDTSIYEAIFNMVLNNVNAVKVKDPIYGMIWQLEETTFDGTSKIHNKLEFAYALPGKADEREKYLMNCHSFINSKKYILNPELFKKTLFPEIIMNENQSIKLNKMIGGKNNELSTIINTIKLSNMTGGRLSYVSDSYDTLNIVKRLEEQNIYLGDEEKDRLNTLIKKHSKYTENLNKINYHLQKLLDVTREEPSMVGNNQEITDITNKFEKKIEKQKKISFKVIDFIEDKLGISNKKQSSVTEKRNLMEFNYKHLEKMFTKKFTLVEDRMKEKVITSMSKDLEELEKKFQEIETVTEDIANTMSLPTP